jgi:replication factor A2
MSYGYEYGMDRGFGGGFNPMGGLGGGGFEFGDISGGFGGAEEKKSSEKKSRDKQSLLPVTVKQLLSAMSSEDGYKVDDVALTTLKLVGTLVAPQEHSTNLNFKLNDGSGTIECKQWIEKDAGAFSKLRSLREGLLVRVVGNLREYEGRTHVLVFDVTPISDWNELTYHILDVVFTHVQNTRGPIPGSASSGAGGMMGITSTPSAMRGPSSSFAVGAAINNKRDDINQAIFNAYASNINQDTGIRLDEVLAILKSKGIIISFEQLTKGVEQLCNDGRLYTTIDEEHHRATGEEY